MSHNLGDWHMYYCKMTITCCMPASANLEGCLRWLQAFNHPNLLNQCNHLSLSQPNQLNLSHMLPHIPTMLNLQVNFPMACRIKNGMSWEPRHHFAWSKRITGFKIDLYWHANFHPNHWRNDEVEILNGILEVPQCKFLCNIKIPNSKAWRHMNTFFRSRHTFTTRFLATIHNPSYPLPSVFPNTCSILPFLLYLANCSSNLDILSIQSHEWDLPCHSTPLLGFILQLAVISK